MTTHEAPLLALPPLRIDRRALRHLLVLSAPVGWFMACNHDWHLAWTEENDREVIEHWQCGNCPATADVHRPKPRG